MTTIHLFSLVDECDGEINTNLYTSQFERDIECLKLQDEVLTRWGPISSEDNEAREETFNTNFEIANNAALPEDERRQALQACHDAYTELDEELGFSTQIHCDMHMVPVSTPEPEPLAVAGNEGEPWWQITATVRASCSATVEVQAPTWQDAVKRTLGQDTAGNPITSEWETHLWQNGDWTPNWSEVDGMEIDQVTMKAEGSQTLTMVDYADANTYFERILNETIEANRAKPAQ